MEPPSLSSSLEWMVSRATKSKRRGVVSARAREEAQDMAAVEVSREDIARRSEERLLVGGPLSICEATTSSSVRGSKLPLETWVPGALIHSAQGQI